VQTRRHPPGHTLPELLIVLAILGIVASMSAPRIAGALDGYAVRTARDATASVLGRARVLALARGSAAVVVDGTTGMVTVESPVGEGAADPFPLAAMFHVAVEADGAPAALVVLRFDGLGVGRFANHTLRFHRGGAEARLTVSSYGRPRRW
jgi:prepilin-type N-terminal cleavage/methylation domain-containing protein